MFYPSISSFIPLLLHLGVSASTANLPQSPDTHFTDLSPRITANSTLFINSSLNPDQVTNVYKSDGKLLYRAIPSSLSSEKFLVIENVLDPLSLKLVKLNELNCTVALDMHYFLDQPKREWTLTNATHQPGPFEAIYKRDPKGGPSGEILVSSTNSGLLAKISNDPNPPSALLRGVYYSIFVSADSGHQPYVTEAEAVALVWLIVQARTRCARLH